MAQCSQSRYYQWVCAPAFVRGNILLNIAMSLYDTKAGGTYVRTYVRTVPHFGVEGSSLMYSCFRVPTVCRPVGTLHTAVTRTTTLVCSTGTAESRVLIAIGFYMRLRSSNTSIMSVTAVCNGHKDSI